MGKIEMLGKIFGDWKVIRELPDRGADGSIMWEVQCQNCGKIEKKNGSNLRSGHSSKCRKCVNKANAWKTVIKDLRGQKFGMLTVIDYTEERTPGGSVMWLCKCDCGNLKKVGTDSLRNGTLSCGCLNSKGEAKIIKLLQSHNIPFEVQKTFKDCVSPITHNNYFFDFWVDNKYIIEYDGEQHFIFKENGWNNKTQFQKTQYNDRIKNEYCFKNNIPIIRIPYTHYNNLCLEDLLLEKSNFVYKENGE